MNTMKRTRKTAIGVALAAMLTTGLGACAGTAHTFTSAERRASDLSHEVERAQNRVDAFAPRQEYRDQAERRLGAGHSKEVVSHYLDLAERRLGLAGR
ncbi:hypothetical protein [Agromyces sp. ZXT2-3]|uniref:hypothetical protein n=1 Tax=Agromyces sp. ZXT2-3 TaxID=3461152 RepID=UPI0040552B7E